MPAERTLVWRIPLGVPPERLPSLRALRSDHERRREAQFAFDQLRAPFVVAYAVLRILLGRILGQEPACLRFGNGPHGKPHLEGARLEFNLSHSGDWAMVAIGHNNPVGVDIEMRPTHRNLGDRGCRLERFGSGVFQLEGTGTCSGPVEPGLVQLTALEIEGDFSGLAFALGSRFGSSVDLCC